MVDGRPHVPGSAVPAIGSVHITPSAGGLDVHFTFNKALPKVPEGVYYAWTVYLYRSRQDAAHPVQTVMLQVEDRGTGWQPAGWTVLASTYYRSTPVEGGIATDKARDRIAVDFPPGFTNLRPPFYWFSSQEVYRGFLPSATKGHAGNNMVYGSIVNDCPEGVRQNTYALPDGSKLLYAKA